MSYYVRYQFFADNEDLMVYLDFRYKLKLRAANKYKMPMIKITSHPNNFLPFMSGSGPLRRQLTRERCSSCSQVRLLFRAIGAMKAS